MSGMESSSGPERSTAASIIGDGDFEEQFSMTMSASNPKESSNFDKDGLLSLQKKSGSSSKDISHHRVITTKNLFEDNGNGGITLSLNDQKLNSGVIKNLQASSVSEVITHTDNVSLLGNGSTLMDSLKVSQSQTNNATVNCDASVVECTSAANSTVDVFEDSYHVSSLETDNTTNNARDTHDADPSDTKSITNSNANITNNVPGAFSDATYGTQTQVDVEESGNAGFGCLPVILNVRGNANDFESIGGDDLVGKEAMEVDLDHAHSNLVNPVSCNVEKLLVKAADESLATQKDKARTTGYVAPISSISICSLSNVVNMETNISSTVNSESHQNNSNAYTSHVSVSSCAGQLDRDKLQPKVRSELHTKSMQNDSTSINEPHAIPLGNNHNSSSQHTAQQLPSNQSPYINMMNMMAASKNMVSLLRNPQRTTNSGVLVKTKSLLLKPISSVQDVHLEKVLSNMVASRQDTTVSDNVPDESISMASLNGHENSNTLPDHSGLFHVDPLAPINFSMHRREIFDSSLLKVSKKPRTDLVKQYVCSVCGDEFHIEENLQIHLERKIFLLSYFCLDCGKTISFYNKCVFWMHIQGETSDWEKRIVNEISIMTLHPYIPSNSQEASNALQRISQLIATQSSQASEVSSCNIETFNKSEKCPFCREHISSLESHFHTFKSYSPCDVCEMVMLNQCSLSAHKAIHDIYEKKRAIFCPECGENLPYSPYLKSVFEHLDSCYHFNVWYQIKCSCGSVLTSASRIKEHIFENHIKSYIGCNLCCHIIPNMKSLHSHYSSCHPRTSFVVATFAQCKLCDSSFRNSTGLIDHVKKEIQIIIMETMEKIYLCLLCSYKCANVSDLKAHMETVHTHKPKRCMICFALFKSRQNLVSHLVSKECSKIIPKDLHLFSDDPKEREIRFDDANFAKIFTSVRSVGTVLAERNDTDHLEDMPVSIIANRSSIPSGPRPVLSKQITKAFASNTKETERSAPKSSTSFLRPSIYLEKRLPTLRPAVNDKRKYQCHLCKICLVGLQNYEKHTSYHHNSCELVTGLTRCVVCKKLIKDDSIATHMAEHQNHGVVVCVLCQRRDFSNMSLAFDHAKNLCYYKEEKGWGEDCFKVRVRQKRHLSDKDTESLPELNSIDNEPLVFPCLMCGLAFSTKQAKEDHVSRVHDGTKIIFTCLLCKRKGLRREFLKRRLALLHVRRHRICSSEAGQYKWIAVEEKNISSGQIISYEKPSRGSPAEAAPPKRLRLEAQGSFLCGRCGFSDEDGDTFEKHIKSHNPKGEPQCPECGLCFTVNAALKKHLFAVHKIKEMVKYLKDRGVVEAIEEALSDEDEAIDFDLSPLVYIDSVEECDALQSKSSQQSGRKSSGSDSAKNTLECTVCYKKFSCDDVLKSHMRNHGMAFIRSRRHNSKNCA